MTSITATPSIKQILFVTFFAFLSTSSTLAGKCHVPASLAGKTVIYRPSTDYSPSNPIAGTLGKLVFSADGSYTNIYLTKEKTYQGKYTYKTVKDDVSYFEATEEYEGKTTKYELFFFCDNDVSGTYIYRQAQGAVGLDARSNTGLWSLDRN